MQPDKTAPSEKKSCLRALAETVEKNADLALSGHTHAGWFFPASLITRIAVGEQRFYGHDQRGNTHTAVTSGAGIFNLPVRIGSRNEVVELILREASHQTVADEMSVKGR